MPNSPSDLELCTPFEFDCLVTMYAKQPGWSMQKMGRHCMDGLVDGARVLSLALVDGQVCHYRKAIERGPVPAFPTDCSYK